MGVFSCYSFLFLFTLPPLSSSLMLVHTLYASLYLPSDWQGPETSHRAVGLRPGTTVCFAVKACNFYGCSDFSERSSPIQIPKVHS